MTDHLSADRTFAQQILENSEDPTARLLAQISLRTLDIAESQASLAQSVSNIESAVQNNSAKFDRLVDALERGSSNGSHPNMKAVREAVYEEENSRQ